MDPWLSMLVDQVRDAMAAPCRACERLINLTALCPDSYCPDCCDAAEHNHLEDAGACRKR